MPIGVAIGVVSAISFAARIGSGDVSLGPGKTIDTLEERDEEDVDDEGGAATGNEGLKEEVQVVDESGLHKESPEIFCEGDSDSIHDSNPKPPSDSVSNFMFPCFPTNHAQKIRIQDLRNFQKFILKIRPALVYLVGKP